MAITPLELWPETTLTTSAASLVQTGAATNGLLIKRAVFTNTSAAPVTITVNKVPSGGSVATANQVTHVFSVAAGEAYVAQELINMVLPPGASIWALASSNTAVNSTASGFVF